MISLNYLTFFLGCLVYCSAAVAGPKEDLTPPKEDSTKTLKDLGYIRYGNPFYIYPNSDEFKFQQKSPNPTEANELGNGNDDRTRVFYILIPENQTSEIPPEYTQSVEVRKKRDIGEDEIPESSKIGKLRKKRTYCGRCGGYRGHKGGYGGFGVGITAVIPVSYKVIPVYYSAPSYPSYGGGCNTCGGGGGGGGGSFSYSSSSSHSSSGSWGYGKK